MEEIIENPITGQIKKSVSSSKERLNLAVPFLSSFSLKIFDGQTTSLPIDKRIITRFDDTNINSFELPTLKRLLDFGFNIRYNNNIHLKLYILDKDVFVTSSNLTKGGFEDNIELSVKVDSINLRKCTEFFNHLWGSCENNNIDYKLLESNWSKYEILRKRAKYNTLTPNSIMTNRLSIGELDIQKVIDEIFYRKGDYSKISEMAFEANKSRDEFKNKLKKGFNLQIFYAPKNHKFRYNNLYYELAYGSEVDLASTGLRDSQFKKVFEHPDFKKVIEYIYPDMIGLEPWNFMDKNIYQEFCNGLFDFDIPQYSESLPIRLASYFYPEFFLPIFKLDHLEEVCKALGLNTDAESKGDRLFIYNTFILKEMIALPFDNYIKSKISYEILYTVELYNRLNKGETYSQIYNSFKKNWKKNYIENGRKILTKLKIIK